MEFKDITLGPEEPYRLMPLVIMTAFLLQDQNHPSHELGLDMIYVLKDFQSLDHLSAIEVAQMSWDLSGDIASYASKTLGLPPGWYLEALLASGFRGWCLHEEETELFRAMLAAARR